MTILLRICDYLSDPKPLRRVARDVRPEEFTTDAFQQFVQDMAHTLYQRGGLGLAATQVDACAPDGEVWRLFVMRGPFEPDGDPDQWIAVVNPRIVAAVEPEWGVEGCLSFRAVGARLRAPTRLRGRHLNEDGRPTKLECSGTHARCYAHEEEHLRGRVILDRMSRHDREKFMREVAKQPRPS